MTDARLRAEVADYARRLHARGWVANHDGNVSVRLGEGRFLATPTATSKAEVTADQLLVVDESGARVQGSAKPFGEIGLHLTIYRHRSDVQAVVHAHSPTASGFASAGLALERPAMAEAVVSLGPTVPLVPYAPAGDAACRALEPFLASCDAVLVSGNGVFAWGTTLEQAYLRLELVEHLARIALVAQQLGGLRGLPDNALPPLLEARRKAGLGQAASATAADPPAPRAVVACAPPPPGSDVVLATRPRKSDLAAMILEEIQAALKKT